MKVIFIKCPQIRLTNFAQSIVIIPQYICITLSLWEDFFNISAHGTLSNSLKEEWFFLHFLLNYSNIITFFLVIYCILRSISKSFLTSTKFILLFSIKVSRFLPTISRFLVLLPKDGYAIQIFPIILNMGCVVPYVYREYEKNGQSFIVPFSIKVPRFVNTISRLLS